MAEIHAHLASLVKRVSDNCDHNGISLIQKAESASRLELLWLQYLSETQLTGTADCLLDAVSSAIREAAACLALGLVRPALNSLRLQIDLTLAWIFFKDHAVEWARVQTNGDGFKLKADLMRYLGDSFDRFGTRFALLRECKQRTQDDPYRLLSAHAHGQSQYVLPRVVVPEDVVASAKDQEEFVELQSECAEFLSDVLWAVYADRWTNIPTELLSKLEGRFKTSAQRATFFS